jgi:diguanylate cyclase (GGDEF)-like protein
MTLQERLVGAGAGVFVVALTYGFITLPWGWAVATALVGILGSIVGGYVRGLRLLAERDELTGISNRRPFERLLDREWALAVKKQKPLGLIFLDIDDFGAINKRFGHLTGDEVLKMLARQIRLSIRKADLLARWGGEEFVVLLPETDAAQALQIAERVRSVIEEGVIRDRDWAVSVTISTGVSTYPGRANSSVDLLRQAIEAQMTAKLKKNVVEVVS